MMIRREYLFFSIVLLQALFATQVVAETVLRGPYLQMGSPNEMTVRWRTDIASGSTVKFDTDLINDLAFSANNATVTTEHEVRLTGLQPSTKYYYAVLDGGNNILAGNDAGHFFITSPPHGSVNTTRAWIIGDSGTANANAINVYNSFVNQVGSEYTDLWIMLGDNAYNDGTDSEYQASVFDIYGGLLRQTPLWSTLGNHDGHSADSASLTGPYYDIFTLPTSAEVGGLASGTEAYYSFDYGQIHFICLDSYDTDRSPGSPMLTWLENDLIANQRKWIIAFWHHPPYTKGSHDSDGEGRLIDMRQNVLPILEDYGVDLILAGHSHSYERSKLVDGHYGLSSTYVEATMALDAGDGRESGDGAYQKFDVVNDPNNGAVYIVAGSSGKTSGGSLNHPVMKVSLNSLGSVLLEVTDTRLDATFLDASNGSQDHFSIIKGLDTVAPTVTAANADSDSNVNVIFSERVDSASAETVGNYSIDQGISVTSTTLQADNRTVQLAVSTLTPGVDYLLTVNNVQDEAGNIIAANSQTTFYFVNLITAEFQSQAGIEDAYIAEAQPTGNFGSSTTLLIDGNDGNGVDLATLLRWDVSSIDSSASVDSATIHIEVFNPSSSSYGVYPLLRSWSESQVTWNQASDGVAWQTAGALGASDRSSNSAALFTASSGNLSIPLNAEGIAAVQAWVNDNANNHGFILADSSSSDGVDFYSSETSTASHRPKLTVVYSLPINGGDEQAPTTPTGLQQDSISTSGATISWTAASDNVGVTGYKVFRDDVLVDTVTGTLFTDSGLSAGTVYQYQVLAFDAANNESDLSAPLAVTTEALLAELHVDNIDMNLLSVGRNKIKVRATISVVDEIGAPVSGVTVNVDWSGLVNQSVTEISDASGEITIDSANVNKNSTGEFIVTVTGLTANGYQYDETANVESSDCISSSGSVCGNSGPVTLGAESVAVSVKQKRNGTYEATALAVVVDNDSGAPVGGAQVLGEWRQNGAFLANGDGDTDTNGEVSLRKTKISAASGDTISFTVTAIMRGSDSYDGVATSGNVIIP